MEDSLIFKHKGQQHTVKSPTMAEFSKIQSLKQVLSGGQYSYMTRTITDEAQLAADMIDMEATLSVLCPSFIESLKVSFSDLGMIDAYEIRKSYMDQFVPWWNNLMKALGLHR